MYVYLMCLDQHTYIGSTEDPSTRIYDHVGWDCLMLLHVPSHLVNMLMGRWKRESRGCVQRVRKGLQLADEHMLTVYVADSDVGELAALRDMVGSPKLVPETFWERINTRH